MAEKLVYTQYYDISWKMNQLHILQQKFKTISRFKLSESIFFLGYSGILSNGIDNFMSFSATNRIRSKKKDIQAGLNELPKNIITVQALLDDLFSTFDSIGKNLVNLASYDIDPDMLDKFDKDFKLYSSKKSEIASILSDVNRISSSLKETNNLFDNSGSSAINESVITDLQGILTNINETIGSDISDKLEELKVLKNELESINAEVKQPVEQINESLQLFKKTTDVSFEIFTKSVLESLKNSVEMRAMTENLESQFFELQTIGENFPGEMKQLLEEQVNSVVNDSQKSLKDEIRSVVNESIVNLDVKIERVLEEKIKDIKTTFSTEISSMIDTKFDKMMETLNTMQTKPEVTVQQTEPLSHDMQEVNIFIKYLYTWPSNKDEILKKIEDFRDNLLMKRTDDPPFRVTATNIFRESISEISREERHISQEKLREIIQLFENLKRTIDSFE